MRTIVAVSAVLLGSAPAWANNVPDNLLGHWALGGECGSANKSIHIAATTLGFGKNKADAVEFIANDSPSGNGAIHWSEEGVVDNFEYDTTNDVLLHNTEGYGIGGAPEVYKRCKS
ncbi:MAG: hypothetical protein JNK47_00165 [Mesorhizobium sp.]|nr:hypothetical protein [Mesorhizobium sp.]MBL8575611.1 hypothetical protein [Mesorhizobium sp.]